LILVERFDLFGNPPSCSLRHGRPPCRDWNWILQPPILYPRRPTSVYPKFQKQFMDFRVPFVSETDIGHIGRKKPFSVPDTDTFSAAVVTTIGRTRPVVVCPQPCFVPVLVHAGGSLEGNESSEACSTTSSPRAFVGSDKGGSKTIPERSRRGRPSTALRRPETSCFTRARTSPINVLPCSLRA